jgi:hypothetical protein
MLRVMIKPELFPVERKTTDATDNTDGFLSNTDQATKSIRRISVIRGSCFFAGDCHSAARGTVHSLAAYRFSTYYADAQTRAAPPSHRLSYPH